MTLSDKDKQHFLDMVCPEYRSLAEDFVNGKLNALCVEYNWSDYGGRKKYGKFGQIFIEIFENNVATESQVILLDENQSSISFDDIGIIRQITREYGSRAEYFRLVKSDEDMQLRWELLKLYVNAPELCSVIMRRKFKKIYEELSDSDKLLLEIGEDYSKGEDE